MQLSPAIHRSLFVFGVSLIAVGLSVGAVFLSLGIVIVSANWMLEGNFPEKINTVKTNKILWAFLLFYFLHLLGMMWSEEMSYGANDLKIKLPLLALPLVFATTPGLSEKEIKKILLIYIGGILLATLWSMVFYFEWKKAEVNNVRDISRFYSHIRFSMNIVFGVFVCAWLMMQSEMKIRKLFLLIIGIWFIFFLFILSSLTGIVMLILLSLVYIIYFALQQKNTVARTAYFMIILLVIGLPIFFIGKTYQYFFPITEKANEKLEQWTPAGDLYFHDKDLSRENGYFVWRHISYPELEQSWNKKSELKFDGPDKKGNPLRFTLLRYMTSLGLRKDSLGFTFLKKTDIQNVEEGIPNYKLAEATALQKRMYDMLWELNDYLENGHLKNHSVMIRVLYWRTSWDIIKNNPITGVGTGDIQHEFEKRYLKGGILRQKEEMRRSHNQFLEIWATLGFTGLLLLLIIVFIPVYLHRKYHPLLLPVALITAFSMFTEDTLETQAGVSLFAFFIPLFLFVVHKDSKADITS